MGSRGRGRGRRPAPLHFGTDNVALDPVNMSLDDLIRNRKKQSGPGGIFRNQAESSAKTVRTTKLETMTLDDVIKSRKRGWSEMNDGLKLNGKAIAGVQGKSDDIKVMHDKADDMHKSLDTIISERGILKPPYKRDNVGDSLVPFTGKTRFRVTNVPCKSPYDRLKRSIGNGSGTTDVCTDAFSQLKRMQVAPKTTMTPYIPWNIIKNPDSDTSNAPNEKEKVFNDDKEEVLRQLGSLKLVDENAEEEPEGSSRTLPIQIQRRGKKQTTVQEDSDTPTALNGAVEIDVECSVVLIMFTKDRKSNDVV